MIACVVIPHFAAAAARMDDPALNGVPLMLVRYSKRSKVVAVSAEAARSGVVPGMYLSRAQAYCPEAHLLAFDEVKHNAVVELLLKQLWEFTNRIEVDGDTFYLDLGRLKDEDAQYLGKLIYESAHTALKAPVFVGLAYRKFTAYAAGVTAREPVVFVKRGEESALLSTCPIVLLPLSKETARKLHLLCIRQIGEFAKLPRSGVISQFGKEGKLLYLLAHGQDSRPVKPRQMPKMEVVSRQFDDSVTDRNRLEVVLHHLADDLARRLDARSSALHAITLTVQFERQKTRTETLYLLQPAASLEIIAPVFSQLLNRIKLNCGIISIEFCAAHLVPNIPRQLELFSHKPVRAQLIDLARLLSTRHNTPFLEAEQDEVNSLIPERRFHWNRIS